jgi:hypothetical protein
MFDRGGAGSLENNIWNDARRHPANAMRKEKP